jgi:DNA invertase Pin-like site-specific DNA recombinase
MRHIAVYVRVSSKAQDERSQLPDLRRWAEVNANGTPVAWYHDKAAGGSMDRAGWQRLDRAASRGEISRIVVWRLDRLGRTASGLTALFDELRRLRVGLVSLRDGLDLETPAGRLMANVIASVAQYENEVRTERILAGQAAARAAGKRWGGSQKGRRLKVQPEQITLIKRLRGEGAAIAAVARATGLSRPTIYSVIRDGS